MKNLIFSILTFCIGLQAHAQKDSVFNQQTYQWEPAVEEFTEKSPGKQLGIFYEFIKVFSKIYAHEICVFYYSNNS